MSWKSSLTAAVLARLAAFNIVRHPHPNPNSSRKRGALRGQARTTRAI
jgi:hypothetical protein